MRGHALLTLVAMMNLSGMVSISPDADRAGY